METSPATPTTLAPALAAGRDPDPFTFAVRPDGKAYARGTVTDDAAVTQVIAIGEAVVGSGNVVLEAVTTHADVPFVVGKATLPSTSFFYTQSNAALSADSQLRLDLIAELMASNPNMVVHISGYSDAAGSAFGNLALSNTRATNVANYLRSKGLVDTQWRLIGVGEEQPIGDNATESGRALNRRVDIQIDGQGLGL